MSSSEHDDLQTSFTRLEGRVSGLEASMTDISADVKGLVQTFNSSQRTNWPLVLGAATMFCTLAVGVWYVIEMKSQVALAPIVAQSNVSSVERSDLRRDLNTIISDTTKTQSEIERLAEKFKEVETQFKASGNYTNLFIAGQHRTNAMIWNATGKLGEYPSGPFFFPSFSQHLPTQ